VPSINASLPRPLLHLLHNLPLFKTNMNFISSLVNCNLSRLRILNRDQRNNLFNLYNPCLNTYTHLDSRSEPRSLRTNHLLYYLHLHGLYYLSISYRIGLRKASGNYLLCHLVYRLLGSAHVPYRHLKPLWWSFLANQQDSIVYCLIRAGASESHQQANSADVMTKGKVCLALQQHINTNQVNLQAVG
jgi:hypothetical protein